jgi:hypothetical protein
MSGKTKGQKCAPAQSRTAAPAASPSGDSQAESAPKSSAQSAERSGVLSAKELQQRLGSVQPEDIFTPASGDYNYHFLAQQGMVSYLMTVGALQYHHQLVSEHYSGLSELIISELYSDNPDWA